MLLLVRVVWFFETRAAIVFVRSAVKAARSDTEANRMLFPLDDVSLSIYSPVTRRDDPLAHQQDRAGQRFDWPPYIVVTKQSSDDFGSTNHGLEAPSPNFAQGCAVRARREITRESFSWD